jgi:hypothetical protein
MLIMRASSSMDNPFEYRRKVRSFIETGFVPVDAEPHRDASKPPKSSAPPPQALAQLKAMTERLSAKSDEND